MPRAAGHKAAKTCRRGAQHTHGSPFSDYDFEDFCQWISENIYNLCNKNIFIMSCALHASPAEPGAVSRAGGGEVENEGGQFMAENAGF